MKQPRNFGYNLITRPREYKKGFKRRSVPLNWGGNQKITTIKKFTTMKNLTITKLIFLSALRITFYLAAAAIVVLVCLCWADTLTL